MEDVGNKPLGEWQASSSRETSVKTELERATLSGEEPEEINIII